MTDLEYYLVQCLFLFGGVTIFALVYRLNDGRKKGLVSTLLTCSALLIMIGLIIRLFIDVLVVMLVIGLVGIALIFIAIVIEGIEHTLIRRRNKKSISE
ncbi:MAG: hypothetical protein LBU20_01895 [Candidatus Nomurabacteria bacterium]|nr:hypothetical protein [Candidatus Nomurabacteria bacterium]